MASANTTDMTEAEVENRSEIVFVYDAEDCNPNGDPYNDNEPRRDQATEQAVVTDVRLKRYLRDQLDDDGHGVFIRTPDDTQQAYTRLEAALEHFENVREPEDFEEIEAVRDKFLKRAVDVRYFGATFSFDVEDEDTKSMIQDKFGSNLQGPVQFSPARSLNRVELNTESRNLTSVLRSGTDAQQGTMAKDKRLKYAIFPFHGVVNERAAEDTDLSEEDVRRLDSLLWRSIRNQTLSRSKLGQNPRLYLRAEFQSGYHHGGLHRSLDLTTHDDPGEIRDVSDVTVDVTELIDELQSVESRLHRIHVCGDDHLECHDGKHREEADRTTFLADDLPQHLDDLLDADIRPIEVWEEYTRYTPDESATE